MSDIASWRQTWFAVLCSARTSGDRDLERMARQNLEEVGIRVIFRKQNTNQRKPAARSAPEDMV